MRYVTQQTATRLRDAGFPQPTPEAGQAYYVTVFKGGTVEHNALCICVNRPREFGRKNLLLHSVYPIHHAPTEFGFGAHSTFAPTADEITAMLPDGWLIEKWGGLYSCSNRDDQSPIRTQADSIVEAAALMWIAINENAASLDISKETAHKQV